MRAVFITLFLTLIGFGYLLSDNGHLHANLEASQQQTAGLATEKDTLQFQLGNARSELAKLAAQNDDLKRQLLFLSDQNQQTQAEKRLIESQNVQLQNQINAMKKLNSLTGALSSLGPVEFLLAIFFPMLPVSMATGFLVYRYGKLHSSAQAQKTGNANKSFSILVTEEEMRQIRKMRRNKENLR